MVRCVLTAEAIPKQTKTFSDADRAKSNQTRQSILATLSEAAQLKELTFKTALELGSPIVSPDESESLRARAQAIAGLVKAWDMACNRIRIQQGKPLPGSHRPEPKQKKVKTKTGPAFTEEQ